MFSFWVYSRRLTEKKENGLWRKLNAEAQFLEAFLLFPSRAIVNSGQLFAGPVITHPQLVQAREQSNWAANYSNKREMIHQATKNSTGVLVLFFPFSLAESSPLQPNDDRFLSGPVSIEACREG
ncbi:hypothetical protein NC651_004942 [Populus alba x Populus x berolinensis]|nr:hypothetical protein NC651_004942 [Populus alba x Populus x berolinensis]